MAPHPEHDAFAMEEDDPPPPAHGTGHPAPPPPPPPPQPAVDAFSIIQKGVRAWPGATSMPLHVVTMQDRRSAPPVSETWVLQAQLEAILYSSPPTPGVSYQGSAVTTGTGALYRLLKRTPGAEGRALVLRRNNTDRVTPQEWEELLDCLHSGVRVLTLLPRDAAIAAVGVFGPSNPSTAVLKALGVSKPPEWDDAEEMSEDEEGEED